MMIRISHFTLVLILGGLVVSHVPQKSIAQSLDIPSGSWGLSLGNSANFTGVRINFRDNEVERIRGLNITLWPAGDMEMSHISGISLGVVPEAGSMDGLNMGFGISAEDKLWGISLGILGAGAGGNIEGIAIGGLGAGAGGNIKGITIGGLGAGAGGNIYGLSVGLLGVGAGGNLYGITLGGLGAGAGGNIAGFTFGVLGAGAGGDITGITIGGLGAGAGGQVSGLTIGGLGAGADRIRGITLAGGTVSASDIQGISVAIGMIKLEVDGQYTGLAVSGFNYMRGRQSGVSIGIINYAYSLKGLQIGLINYVRDNPTGMKLLPLVNFRF